MFCCPCCAELRCACLCDHGAVCRGVIPRAVNDLFRTLAAEYDASSEVTVYCSFMQLYNEKIYDLLRERCVGVWWDVCLHAGADILEVHVFGGAVCECVSLVFEIGRAAMAIFV